MNSKHYQYNCPSSVKFWTVLNISLFLFSNDQNKFLTGPKNLLPITLCFSQFWAVEKKIKTKTTIQYPNFKLRHVRCREHKCLLSIKDYQTLFILMILNLMSSGQGVECRKLLVNVKYLLLLYFFNCVQLKRSHFS